MQGKIVVITGGSSGIGAEMAKQLASKGAIPVITGRSEQRLQQIAGELPGPHGVYVLDVGDTESVRTVMEQIEHDYGRIDVLINNAGFGLFKEIMDTSIEQFADMMDVNYMGVVRCTKAVLPGMLNRQQGHIVNIASVAGKIGSAKSTGYSASKHAVIGFTNSLRQELTGTGVKLTAINPGPIDTPFFTIADPSGNYVKNVNSFLLKPEQVAKAVIRAIERGLPEKNMPRLFSAGIVLSQLFPRTFERVAARFFNKK